MLSDWRVTKLASTAIAHDASANEEINQGIEDGARSEYDQSPEHIPPNEQAHREHTSGNDNDKPGDLRKVFTREEFAASTHRASPQEPLIVDGSIPREINLGIVTVIRFHDRRRILGVHRDVAKFLALVVSHVDLHIIIVTLYAWRGNWRSTLLSFQSLTCIECPNRT